MDAPFDPAIDDGMPPPSEEYQQANPRWDLPAEESEDPPSCINGDWWLTRDLPRPQPLLGEVICSTTRMLLGGPTGAGKTNFAMAIGGAFATGQKRFLHWTLPGTPVTVLYVDGEMARDLIQDRLRDLQRRLGSTSLANFHMLCREDFPAMEGLNTKPGQDFLKEMIKAINPAVVILDSRMCLIVGDMKDEVPWTETMPLVWEITRQKRAQIWLDHTGHDASHIYGSKTKEWQMDVVAMLEEHHAKAVDISVMLKFTKARRRRPETRADFANVIISLERDQWFSTPTEDGAASGVKVRPSRIPFYEALMATRSTWGAGKATLAEWQDTCIRKGLIEKGSDTETASQRKTRFADWARAKSDFIAAKWISIDGEIVMDLKERWV